jgi:nitrogen fixation protein NifU and related proteins
MPNPTSVNQIEAVSEEFGKSADKALINYSATFAGIIMIGRSRGEKSLDAESPRNRAPIVFNDAILDHFRNPHNAGDLSNATATVEVTNPVCGDILRLSVRLDAQRIAEARFKTQGCVAAIASSSVLTDLLLGKSPAELRGIVPQQISDVLGGLPPATFHAAQLCGEAVAALLKKIS